MSDDERIAKRRQLEADALAWAQSKRDEGHTVQGVVEALYQTMLNIVPKNDPTRLPILEGAREHLIKTIKREQDEQRDQ